ncbi:MAG: hypothetical protein JW881_13560 [Spirochaetales bacterium]|nr:hypothetical protein [Spirochaetales bacterium]
MADNQEVRRIFFFLFIVVWTQIPGYSYRILYAEQYYRLYHIHFYQYPDDCLENINYLEHALAADFCNPLYALARIENKQEWERYRCLFKMHVNLKLTQLYLTLASGYDKRIAYFYNAPWKEQNLKSLAIAEKLYRTAITYWNEARQWSSRLTRIFRYNLEEIQNWEDEHYRIQTKELDYDDIIQSHLKRLAAVRSRFEHMDDSTY